MPKDTKTLGNSKARACESLGFVHKKGCARVLTQPPRRARGEPEASPRRARGYFISVGFGSEIECQRHRHQFLIIHRDFSLGYLILTSGQPTHKCNQP